MMGWAKTQTVSTVVAVATIGGTGSVIAVKTALAQDRATATVNAAAAPKAKAEAPTGQLDKKANSGIVSVADAPPVIVSASPQSGATDVDAAAVTELKVTFSKDMETGNFSWVRYGKDTFPQTTGKPHFLDDKRTCVLPVKLEPGHPYVVWLNKPPYDSFMDPAGHKAVQYLLVFETKK